jgi:hypothetical protein
MTSLLTRGARFKENGISGNLPFPTVLSSFLDLPDESDALRYKIADHVIGDTTI